MASIISLWLDIYKNSDTLSSMKSTYTTGQAKDVLFNAFPTIVRLVFTGFILGVIVGASVALILVRHHS